MKKLLALVLALVMVLSLCVVSSNAAYTDKADIDLKEAADVMTAIGVFQGSDGKFDPKANLTREQAAKLVAYLQVGQKAADALVGGGKFTDVAKDRWSAGYVDYCASIGIAAGVGDGKFDPTGSLTALQFGKMLLVCLGYDAKAEGLTGTDWSINTSKLMSAADLLAGLKDVTAYSVVTREQAAQMMLNALKAPMVEYATKATSISVNGADVVFGGSTASYVTGKLSSANNISNAKLNDNTSEAIIELGEKLFTKLKLDEDYDAFMRPANVWTYKSQEIGTYTDAEDLLYTDTVELGQIYKDLGLGKTTTAAYYIDGVLQPAGKVIAKSSTAEVGGHGTETYVYYFSSTGAVKICEVNWYIGDVAAVYKATATKDAYVTIAGRGTRPSGNFTTEKFALDDVVLYNVSLKDGKAALKNVELAPEAITGALTNYVVGKSATVGGTTYKYSNKIANVASDELTNRNIDAKIVLDKYGFVIDIDSTGVKNYAVIEKIEKNVGTYNDTVMATLVFTDGTVKKGVETTNVAVDVAAGANALEVGDIVSYVINSKGEYTLAELATVKTQATSTTLTYKIVSNGEDTLDSASFTGTYGNKVNGKTIFIVKDSSKNYSSYTGIKNVPSIVTQLTNGTPTINVNSYVKAGDTFASLVFVDASANANVNTSSTIFVFAKPTVTVTKDEEIGNYYEFTAFIDGEEKTLKVNATQGAALVAGGVPEIYDSVSYNADGIATLGSALTTRGAGTVAAKNGVIGLAGKFYSYADNCKVVYINTNNEISASSVGAIATDADDFVWYKVTSGDVTYIYIKENAAVTYYSLGTSTNVAFYSDLACTTAITEAYEGQTVYVKSTTAGSNEMVTSETVNLLPTATVAVDGTNGIYKFVMGNAALADETFTAVELYKLTIKTDAVGHVALVNINGEVKTVDSTGVVLNTLVAGDVVTLKVTAVDAANTLAKTTANKAGACTLWNNEALNWTVTDINGSNGVVTLTLIP